VSEARPPEDSPEPASHGEPLRALLALGIALSVLVLALTVATGLVAYHYFSRSAASRRSEQRVESRAAEDWDGWRGRPAPPLELRTLDGHTLDLATLRGRHVLLDFWATWCRPCVESIPDLNRLAREWRQELVVVGITDEDPEHVRGFVKTHTIEYPIVAGLEHHALPEPFRQVRSFPTLVFVRPDGTIGSVLVGGHRYDCLESRIWLARAAESWARGERAEARRLAGITLEVHIEDSLERELAEIFGSDPEYAQLHQRVKGRVEGLVGYYERTYHREFGRDRATVVWVIWSLGAERKDRDAVPLLARYLKESALEEARWRAADSLWLIGDRRAVPDLLAALEDPSLKVAGFAASALGDLGDASAVEPLLALFQRLPDNREEAKARVADALGKLGDPRALPLLSASLERIREPGYLRWAEPAVRRLQPSAAR
jgi:thiol-disulfide isomerase/thioredoxin